MSLESGREDKYLISFINSMVEEEEGIIGEIVRHI